MTVRRIVPLLLALALLTGCARAGTQDVTGLAPEEGERLVICTPTRRASMPP